MGNLRDLVRGEVAAHGVGLAETAPRCAATGWGRQMVSITHPPIVSPNFRSPTR